MVAKLACPSIRCAQGVKVHPRQPCPFERGRKSRERKLDALKASPVPVAMTSESSSRRSGFCWSFQAVNSVASLASINPDVPGARIGFGKLHEFAVRVLPADISQAAFKIHVLPAKPKDQPLRELDLRVPGAADRLAALEAAIVAQRGKL